MQIDAPRKMDAVNPAMASALRHAWRIQNKIVYPDFRIQAMPGLCLPDPADDIIAHTVKQHGKRPVAGYSFATQLPERIQDRRKILVCDARVV